jgi:ribosomal protein S18 acetylase RimI-like enzyme
VSHDSEGLAPNSRPTTVIEHARPEDGRAIAGLHVQGLRDGFLSSLGPRFLAHLYRAMIASPEAIVLVAREGAISGFAAAAADPGRFWRDFLRRRFLQIGARLLMRAWRPHVAKGVLEVARHLRREESLSPQLLAIVVGTPSRRAGLGGHLVSRLEEELRGRNAHQLTVSVRDKNQTARRFFERLGFHPLGRLDVHEGQPSLRYVRAL